MIFVISSQCILLNLNENNVASNDLHYSPKGWILFFDYKFDNQFRNMY